jgi:hypothetical protein
MWEETDVYPSEGEGEGEDEEHPWEMEHEASHAFQSWQAGDSFRLLFVKKNKRVPFLLPSLVTHIFRLIFFSKLII